MIVPIDSRANAIRNSIAISVGTVLFLLFALFCYIRELGPKEPSMGLPGFLIGLGACVTVIGVIEAGGHPPGERGFGWTLATEGALLVVLTLLAWWLVHPAASVLHNAIL